MKFDFTTMPDRRGMDSIAVDMNPNDFWTLPKGETKPEFDKIPMWIADMNFPTAPSVTRALERRIQHPYMGIMYLRMTSITRLLNGNMKCMVSQI